MTRLTTYLRDTICTRVLEHRFKSLLAEQQERELLFGQVVYLDLYPENIRDLMQRLPAGFLPTRKEVKAMFGETFAHVYFPEDRRVAEAHDSFNVVVKRYDADHPLSGHYHVLEADRERLEEEQRAASRGINSVLGSVSTLSRLLQVWPEVRPFLSNLPGANPPRPTALALPLPALNELLNLPKEL